MGIVKGAIVTVTRTDGVSRTDTIQLLTDRGLALTTPSGHDPGSFHWGDIASVQVAEVAWAVTGPTPFGMHVFETFDYEAEALRYLDEKQPFNPRVRMSVERVVK